MNRLCWWLVEALSGLLEPDERDAVRGDLVESGGSGGQALRDLAGLVGRRQCALWKDWRPWVAPIGLVAPVLSAVLGIGWIGWQFRTIWTHGVRYDIGLPLADDIVRLACFCILAVAWAWSGGFALGSLSRRTAWVHPALLCLLLWLCVEMGRALPTGRLRGMLFWLLPWAVLFLIPFLSGTYRGVRPGGLGVGRAVWMAALLAVLTLVAQVEDGRSSLAFAAWSSGRAVDGRLAWTPRLLPFAAIAWQFGLIFATNRFQENSK